MPGARATPQESLRWFKLLAAFLLLVGGTLLTVSPAWAHGAGETTESYALVQQALGYLAHSTDPASVMQALGKVDDALATRDQYGVNISLLQQAKASLKAGRLEKGRALLQKSIQEAVSQLKPATGEDTGTHVVLSEMPGRAGLNGGDWGLLGASVLLLLAGIVLGVKYRPKASVSQLRKRLTTTTSPSSGTQDHSTLTKDT